MCLYSFSGNLLARAGVARQRALSFQVQRGRLPFLRSIPALQVLNFYLDRMKCLSYSSAPTPMPTPTSGAPIVLSIIEGLLLSLPRDCLNVSGNVI